MLDRISVRQTDSRRGGDLVLVGETVRTQFLRLNFFLIPLVLPFFLNFLPPRAKYAPTNKADRPSACMQRKKFGRNSKQTTLRQSNFHFSYACPCSAGQAINSMFTWKKKSHHKLLEIHAWWQEIFSETIWSSSACG
jgi:hypothetical protein